MGTSIRTICGVSLLVMALGAGCNIQNPDHLQPEVTVTSPADSAIVPDSVLVEVTATDNEQVARVEFFVDNVHDSTADDREPPYAYMYTPGDDAAAYGSTHTLYAKAYDFEENEMISNFVKVFYLWKELGADPDESLEIDWRRWYLRSTSDAVEFRLETYRDWEQPTDSSGMNLAIFMDTDRDSTTGLSPDSLAGDSIAVWSGTDSVRYDVRDIGPDYLLLIGWEDTGLYEWNADEHRWERSGDPEAVTLNPDTNYVEARVSLDVLGDPEAIDLAAANLSVTGGGTEIDWLPDIGHFSGEIRHAYLGRKIK